MGLILLVENLDQYEAAVRSVKSANDQVSTSMVVVDKRSRGADKGLAKMAGSFALGTLAARTMMKVLRSIKSAFEKVIVTSTMVGARNEVLANVLEEVGSRAGYSTEQLDKYTQALQDTGITLRAARQSLLQMIQSNIDLGLATDLARVAQNAGIIANLDSSASYLRIIDAVQRGEPIILKTLGLTVDFVAAEERVAAQLDTTREALTEQQAIQARANEVMRAGTSIAGAYEKAMGSAGKQMTSIPRYVEDIQQALSKLTLPTFTEGITVYTDALKSMEEWLVENEESLSDVGEAFGMLASAIADIELPSPEVVEFVNDLATLAAVLAVGIETTENFRESNSLLAESLDRTLTVLDALNKFAAWPITLMGLAINKMTEMRLADEDLFKTQARLNKERIASMDAVLQKELDIEGQRRRAYRDALAAMRARADAEAEITEDQIAAAEKLADLRLDLQRELVDDMIDEERRLIEQELRLAREREDTARRVAASIASAYATAAKDRAAAVVAAAEDRSDFERDALRAWTRLEDAAARNRERMDQAHADRRVDIETATRRRLQDIQRQFEMSVQDAARTRDAFALVQAQRRAASDRGAALRGRDEQLADAKNVHERQERDYEKSLAAQREDLRKSLSEQEADLEKSLRKRQQEVEARLAEELASIEANRVEEEKERARAMDREREDTARQAAWEQDDRTRRLQRQLQDMEIQYGDLGDVTAEGLMEQAQEWADTYGPAGAVSRIVEGWARLMDSQLAAVVADLDDVTAAANRVKVSLEALGQLPPYMLDVHLNVPPELELHSPKLGLQIGFENLEKMLARQPMPAFMAGGLPAASGAARSETYSRTESRHDINMNIPGDLDLVVQRQLAGVLTQTFKGIS